MGKGKDEVVEAKNRKRGDLKVGHKR